MFDTGNFKREKCLSVDLDEVVDFFLDHFESKSSTKSNDDFIIQRVQTTQSEDELFTNLSKAFSCEIFTDTAVTAVADGLKDEVLNEIGEVADFQSLIPGNNDFPKYQPQQVYDSPLMYVSSNPTNTYQHTGSLPLTSNPSFNLEDRANVLKELPNEIAKAINSDNMQNLQQIIDNNFIFNCVVNMTEYKNAIIGRQFIFDLFSTLHRLLPDFVFEVSPTHIINRVIITSLKITGSRTLNTKTLDCIPDSYKGLLYIHLIMNEEKTCIEHYISTPDPSVHYFT